VPDPAVPQHRMGSSGIFKNGWHLLLWPTLQQSMSRGLENLCTAPDDATLDVMTMDPLLSIRCGTASCVKW